MLPLVLGGPGELLREVVQGRVGQALDLFLLPGVVPGAATGTWWLCWPRGTAPGGSAGQSGWVRPRICYSYLGWFLVLPLVLGGSVGPGELLQEVAQGRVGQAQHLLLLPGVVPGAATGTWWPCGPGELLQEVAQGRVGGSGPGAVPLTWGGS